MIIIFALLTSTYSYSQSAKKSKITYDKRLGRKDVIIEEDSIYKPLYMFLIENRECFKDEKPNLIHNKLLLKDTNSFGIYRFEIYSPHSQIFLYLKDKNSNIKVIENYEITEVLKSIQTFLETNHYLYNDKCEYIKSIMDFLIEKNSYKYEIEIQTK